MHVYAACVWGGDSRAFELLNFTADEAKLWRQSHQLKTAADEFAAPEPIMNADAKVAAVSQGKVAGLD